ncbi:hypothetical protein B0H13DRAFT_2338508 [Mycena leptocephala]|nr:hypothetical protein B0H13DRAFT_2338508 [Mycena leptocephala]
MPMKLTKAQRHAAASSSPTYELLPRPSVPHPLAKVPAHIARWPDVQLFGGITLIQPRLPSLLGQFGLTELRNNARRPPPMSPSDAAANNFAEAASDDPDMMPIDDSPPAPDPNPGASERRSGSGNKVPTQLGRIPPQLKPLRLQHQAPQGRNPIEDLELQVCKCTPAAVQLMQVSAFGCAPILPSLAVDLRVLEFTMNLFLQVAPNNTAISIALERVLSNMGFQLDHQNSLRRRFGNCLMWYTHLRNRLKAKYSGLLEAVHEVLVPQAEAEPEEEAEEITPPAPPPLPHGRQARRSGLRAASSSGTPTPPSPKSRRARVCTPSPSPSASRSQRRAASPSPSRTPTAEPLPGRWKRNRESSPGPEIPFPEPPPRVRPSEYLHRRCPACFADANNVIGVDVMVSIDACFTQKKKKSPKDPPKYHPDTHFVPEDLAAKMEAYVDSVRNASNNETCRKRQAQDVEEEEEDGYEHKDLLLPRSVLDRCEASFKAADEKREKASTEFFEDTGLMALLCRHDRVLWVLNMHSAGEKQFSVILLIERLFEHLPRKVRVGILYDIGCLLERSCLKWGFLSRWIDRIVFAVSVFHAFRHEWACQLLYHPRKRRGFGLSNGEGCEQFWNSIRHLIPHLRISGYHNHLYTLDAQIEHTDETSLLRLGQWVSRRYAHGIQKRAEATKAFWECGKSQTLLREQWKLQVVAQTKPLPRRAKNRGEKAVNGVILLRSAVTARQGLVRDLRQKFLDGVMEDDPEAAMYETEFKAAEEALRKLTELLRRKEAALGVDEQQELYELASSDYMCIRMNTRALKIRLRLRLRARKFELDPVERALRRLVNDSKLQAHTVSTVKHREPTITKLAGEYNKLCAQITKLIKDSKAPRGSIAPVPIPAKGLWQLDVDDAIFQDVGLDDNDDGSTEPPLWLCDDQVRRRGCSVVTGEVRFGVWFAEEWDIVIKAMEDAESEVDRYHLRLHQDKLVRLCATWDKHLPNFGVSTVALPPWGPSTFQMAQCNVDAHLAAHGEDRHYREETEGSDGEGEEESGGEDEDFATLDVLERADIYRGGQDDQ